MPDALPLYFQAAHPPNPLPRRVGNLLPTIMPPSCSFRWANKLPTLRASKAA
ncbi:hypothetical protein [Kingella sp. (in: b-proteobacteria)]|uniref:hypothetical protein n=1 Tax=Kingella sp. (in: b-proteobacteria) TaxID=2020713 RepID=UPI0026DC2F0A|nr:hypothetical protein [Kingella sp. (in: b-proteobacteria)]MDO4656551.1 hypothetical protein [Kingella sp. (in: b-proteobacteria)]